ncbi:hypothetical protein lerEdw1_014066 [Lerista edwardsae]|nr:hypothetical protein lerEdw1_014067 [Lerista edwardsae]KAJ6634355.1 hypothetical protein lerEdw1_014066 [Lerista edwardsae]
MENATVGSANAIVAISGTTATAQQRPNNVSPMTARCAVGEATASAGNVSAQNLVPLGRLVRNAPPALVSAARKETDDPNSVLCAYPVKDCVMKFTYSELTSGKTNITVLKEPECGTAPNVMMILLAVVGSIVLLGIILLGIWKLLVTIHDRREFARFQSERSRARYEVASNPLYRKPISTHSLDFTFNKLNRSYNGTID